MKDALLYGLGIVSAVFIALTIAIAAPEIAAGLAVLGILYWLGWIRKGTKQ